MIRIIFSLTFLALLALPCQAQNYPISDDYSGNTRAPVADSFNSIKRDIATLLKENHRLENEFRSVQAETEKIRAEFNQKRKEADYLRHESGIVLRKAKNEQYSVESVYGDLETLKNEILLKRSRVSYLQGQILMMREKQDLWETQLKDLKNQQEQIHLMKEKGEYSIEDRINAQKLEITRLQKEIDDLNEQRQSYYDQYRLFSGSSDGKAVLNVVEKENDIIRKQIAILEKERDLLYREQDNLEKQFKLQSSLNPQNPYFQPDYKAELKEDVKRLEERYKNLNATLQSKFDRAEHYRKLNQEFIEASRKNQELRLKLDELQ